MFHSPHTTEKAFFLLVYAGLSKYLSPLVVWILLKLLLLGWDEGGLFCLTAGGQGFHGLLNWGKQCWKHTIPNLCRAQDTLGFWSHKSVQSVTSAGAHGLPLPITFFSHIQNWADTQPSPGRKDEGPAHPALWLLFTQGTLLADGRGTPKWLQAEMGVIIAIPPL